MISSNKIKTMKPNIYTSWIYTEFFFKNTDVDDEHIEKALAGYAPYAEDISIKLIKWYNDNYEYNNKLSSHDLIGFLLNVMQESSNGLKHYLKKEESYINNKEVKFQVFSNEFYFYLLTVFNRSIKINKKELLKQILASSYALNENITEYGISKIINEYYPSAKIDFANLKKIMYGSTKKKSNLTDDGAFIIDLSNRYKDNIESCKDNLIINILLLSGSIELFANSSAFWNGENSKVISDIISYKPKNNK